MNIRSKIIIGSVLSSILTVVGVGYLVGSAAIIEASDSLESIGKNSLVSVRNSKKDQVENYFQIIRGQLSTYSDNQMIINAMSGFAGAFEEIGQEITRSDIRATPNSYYDLKQYYNGPFTEKFKEQNNGEDPVASDVLTDLNARTLKLQNLYIAENKNPLGSKDLQIEANDGSRYSKLHKQYHPFIRNYMKQFGYYDILLINNSGDVVYSVFKGLDYATNLISGPYTNSGLGRAFRASRKDGLAPDTVSMIDFASYYPSYNGATSFFSSPIYDGENKLGILIMQAPVDKLNELMTSNKAWKEVGLGDSGETYIVGSNHLMRNDSRFLIEDEENYLKLLNNSDDKNADKIAVRGTSIGLQNAKTKGTTDALKGNTGFDIFPNYRGINVLSAYTPLNIPGLRWALMSEIDEEEALRPIAKIKNDIIKSTSIIGLIALSLFGIGAFLLIRSITKPLSQLKKTMGLVAGGDLSARANMTSGDELEELGNAFDGMLDNRIATMEEAEAQNQRLNSSVLGLINATSQLADKDLTIEVPVEEDVTGKISDALNMMVEEISDVLSEISNVSKQVDDSVKLVQAQTISSKSAANNDKTIIKSTIGQLIKVSNSIKNISGLVKAIIILNKRVQVSSSNTALTVDKNIEGMGQIKDIVAETEERMTELGKNSQEIDDIVAIINNLSERTNVLAMSAKMHALNAGETGLEFVMIADEIKRISESSKKSTFEISSRIQNIKLGISQATTTMASTIERVNEGASLAGKVGLEMHKTQSDAAELAIAIKRIYIESQSQNQANAAMMSQANKVLASTKKTSVALDKQSVQTTMLVAYANGLRSEVGSFKLRR